MVACIQNGQPACLPACLANQPADQRPLPPSCRSLSLLGERLAGLDANLPPAAEQLQPSLGGQGPSAHQVQLAAACWLVCGCFGLVCQLADLPTKWAFLRSMQLVLHSGAEAQKAAWMGALAASTSWSAILMNAIVQPKAVTA